MSETSDMRRTLMAAICSAVYQSTPEAKRQLAATLDVMPFETMSDDALIDMAIPVIGAAEVERICVALSAQRYEHRPEYFLCPACLDEHVVPVDDRPGWWQRCERCNPKGVVEPGAKARGRRQAAPA